MRFLCRQNCLDKTLTKHLKLVSKDKFKWENQQEATLANAKQHLKKGQNSEELLKSISSKQKLIKDVKKYSETGRKGGHSWQSARLHI